MNDDPKRLLAEVTRKQIATRERLRPGSVDLLMLLLATAAAAGISGSYDSATSRAVGIGMAVVAAVVSLVVLRSRTRLGGRIHPATWVTPAALFVADLAIGSAVHGSGRDAAMAIALAAASATLGVALHSRWLVGVGGALLVVMSLGLAFSSHVGSIASFGLGLVFGVGAVALRRRRLAKR